MIAPHRPFLAALFLLWLAPAAAEPQYPALVGRVVDQAELLPAETRRRLETKLAEHENATGNQVVVVTLSSLQGYAIEDFGVGLGRGWGIGQRGRDNGVLLIVAPNEREVRIEVGYGLEGQLTDAIGRDIIENRILPSFRAGDMAAGVEAGVESILSALRDSYVPAEPSVDFEFWLRVLIVVVLLAFFWYFLAYGASSGTGRRYGGLGGPSGGGSSSPSGGFSGGGGSFGGGGASGSW